MWVGPSSHTHTITNYLCRSRTPRRTYTISNCLCTWEPPWPDLAGPLTPPAVRAPGARAAGWPANYLCGSDRLHVHTHNYQLFMYMGASVAQYSWSIPPHPLPRPAAQASVKGVSQSLIKLCVTRYGVQVSATFLHSGPRAGEGGGPSPGAQAPPQPSEPQGLGRQAGGCQLFVWVGPSSRTHTQLPIVYVHGSLRGPI